MMIKKYLLETQDMVAIIDFDDIDNIKYIPAHEESVFILSALSNDYPRWIQDSWYLHTKSGKEYKLSKEDYNSLREWIIETMENCND